MKKSQRGCAAGGLLILVLMASLVAFAAGTVFLSRRGLPAQTPLPRRIAATGQAPPAATVTRLLVQPATPRTRKPTSTRPAPSPTREPLPTTQATPIPIQTSTRVPLSLNGPWVILPARDGLWGMNTNGSGLTRLASEWIAGPGDFSAARNPHAGLVAYVSAGDLEGQGGLQLKLLHLPDGTVKSLAPLAPAQSQAGAGEVCDPAFEAVRAVTLGSGLAWSPDGQKLAFVSAVSGAAEIYVYSLASGQILHLAGGEGQAYELHWSPDGQYIIYFSATCFGSGAGFTLAGAWAARLDNGVTVNLYRPDPSERGELFYGWLKQANAFYVASYNAPAGGCLRKDLRLVEAPSGKTSPVFPGCYNDAALGPSGVLAVVVSAERSDQPGVYIYAENRLERIDTPVYVPEPHGQLARVGPNGEIEVQTWTDNASRVRSFNAQGQPGFYNSPGDFPLYSPDGADRAWQEQDAFYLALARQPPRILTGRNANFPFWFVEESPQNGRLNHLVYDLQEENSATLYMASPPDYQPAALLAGINPLDLPVMINK